MEQGILIKGGALITMDSADRILEADLLIQDGRIDLIVERDAMRNGSSNSWADLDENKLIVIDAAGRAVLPGFVQTHIHLCQTLMRGAADDLRLLDWLKHRIWPLEAAHTSDTIFTSALLGIAELIQGGTTCALTMETVRNTASVFEAVEATGFRAAVGKCMMDRGVDAPRELIEDSNESLEAAVALAEEWNGRANGRIRAALAPRFALSCSRLLLEKISTVSRERRLPIHTHASETSEETRIIQAETGLGNIQYLNALGLTDSRSVFAHCVWADDREIEILVSTGTAVAHCPSSNLKLGSGIAPIAEMSRRGVKVSLGADGAPCNNRLDQFTEMRTAALLQKIKEGPESLPARQALRMATIEGARALGLDSEIGSIEEGKRADLMILRLDELHLLPQPDLVSSIVYAGERSDVETVIIDGRLIMEHRKFLTIDEEELRSKAREDARKLFERARL